MSWEDYEKAYRAGKKDYQMRLTRGQQPTIKILDDILPHREHYTEVPLGLVQIPADQIVGTKTGGRSSSFAGNFMPILRRGTEFASKWISLSDSHLEEGIHDPVKAYEYMNEFYVEEGNKRVSVLKYFDAVSIPGYVIRILPPRTNEKKNRIYYEFVDFYELSKINYISLSKPGSFARLQEAVGKGPRETWSEEDRLDFNFIYTKFKAEYEDKGGNKLSITSGDAFLTFITLFDYKSLADKTSNEIGKMIEKSWEEFKLLQEDNGIELKMDPVQGKKPLKSILLSLSLQRLKIAFIYEKTPTSSAWTYAHELGRLHLEQAFPNEITTIYYENVTQDNIDETIADAIKNKCNIIFTTTPTFVNASVKAGIEHRDVRILNCSLNTSHRYIRTYYSRMHEAKFLMGAIAGALTENNRLGYIADYPILGSIANINAFALGAKMINPRARVYLEWSKLKDNSDALEKLLATNVSVISGMDMIIPEEASRFFGLYYMENNIPYSLAMPIWHWGKFYERLVRTIMDGTWESEEDATPVKAINYWWGMSAGVIEVICSQNLPIGTKRLIDLLKKTIGSEEFNPFSGILYSQTGIIQGDPNVSLSPEEIVTMDWLAENIIGTIPSPEDLREDAQPVVSQQGIETAVK